jgi:hypothetical protein
MTRRFRLMPVDGAPASALNRRAHDTAPRAQRG